MPRLIYTNELGQSIKFSDRPPYVLTKIEGLGDLDADIQTQKAPYQDGETHIDTLFEPRYINMEISIVGENVDDLRRQLSKVMNPKVNGILRYEEETIVKEIECINEHVPKYPTKNKFHHVAIVDLIAPNPYWKSPTIEEQPTFEPLFQFPFEGAFQMGIQRDERIIHNDSDTEVPIQVEFYGPAINPIITNKTTGEFIKVNQTLQENEYMRIDTTEGKKSVVFVNIETGEERNVFNWIDLGSTFFQLQIGQNEIEYSADNDIQGAIVNIYWQKHFVGV